MTKLIIDRTTFLKARPLQSSSLREEELTIVRKGEVFEIEGWKPDRNKHLLVTFRDGNRSKWFAYQNHVRIEVDAPSRPKTVKLKVPFKSQLDNRLNPTGSCNVTSIAMCLEFLQTPRRKNTGQFEDELYEYAIAQNYSRHSPADLARVVRDYGRSDSANLHS